MTNGILSINLPTGIGKTLAGLSFALNLRERIKNEYGFTPKVIYSLPFLSIIDQNGEIIEDIFKSTSGYAEIPSNLFLKHHHLTDVEYKEEKNNELNLVEDINKSLLLTEGWHSEIVITTFVQFFHSLITNKNRAARKFHNIINSIIILDEIQSIPTDYWLLINRALKYLSENFNCWVILMTATEPFIFEKGREIKDLVGNKENYFRLFNRYEFNFDIAEKNFNNFSEEIFNEIININNKDKDIMVVLNTIGSCQRLYEHIKNKLSIHYKELKNTIDRDGICVLPELELINLSTHILPNFRLYKINRIKNDNKRKIIITTQLIEAGVDISVDVIYRDLAPLDCLVQSAGRCNRHNKKQGVVNIIALKDDKTQRRYYSIYDSVLIEVTKEIIQKWGQTASEREFILNAEDKYYHLVNERKSKERSRKLLNHLERLNFGDIFEFKLIEEKLHSTSIFVEIDENAERLRKEVEEILAEKNRLERRKKLLKIKNDINKNTISIKIKEEKIQNLPPIGEMKDLKYIPHENLENWYKLDIGFQAPESDIDLRML